MTWLFGQAIAFVIALVITVYFIEIVLWWLA